MKKISFTKMHGLGNDYVYVDCFSQEVPNPAAFAQKISDRHFGIGSDGLILVCPSEKADIRMRMFNSDGSEGMMCGNGIRCVAKFAFERGLSRKNPMQIETASGVKILELTVNEKQGEVSLVKVDMGEPIFEAPTIPVMSVTPQNVLVPEVALTFTSVSMGNPHAVCFVEHLTDELVLHKGPIVEKHPLFPNKVNVEFVKVLSPERLQMRVWERGSGETQACGTGACAVAVAAALTKRAERKVLVQLLGGDLQIEWAANNHVFMSGPATNVFDGSITI